VRLNYSKCLTSWKQISLIAVYSFCKTHKLRASQSGKASIDCDRVIDSLIESSAYSRMAGRVVNGRQVINFKLFVISYLLLINSTIPGWHRIFINNGRFFHKLATSKNIHGWAVYS
jgi:hypothetical protein